MKPLIALLIILFCCSFTIRQKFVSKNKNDWEIFIYPDSSDSTTYIQETYNKTEPYTTRKLPAGEWVRHSGHSVYESVYINGDDKRSSEFSHYEDYSTYSEYVHYNAHQSESKRYPTFPSSMDMYLNDSTQASVGYFNDATIQSFTLEIGHHSQHRSEVHSIEWDSLHQYYWQGEYNRRHYATDTTIIEEKETGVQQSVVTHQDIDEKTGLWKRYNRLGLIIDSIYYK